MAKAHKEYGAKSFGYNSRTGHTTFVAGPSEPVKFQSLHRQAQKYKDAEREKKLGARRATHEAEAEKRSAEQSEEERRQYEARHKYITDVTRNVGRGAKDVEKGIKEQIRRNTNLNYWAATQDEQKRQQRLSRGRNKVPKIPKSYAKVQQYKPGNLAGLIDFSDIGMSGPLNTHSNLNMMGRHRQKTSDHLDVDLTRPFDWGTGHRGIYLPLPGQQQPQQQRRRQKNNG